MQENFGLIFRTLYRVAPVRLRLRFGDGTVRAVPVLGSGGSSKGGGFFFCVFQYSFCQTEDSSGSSYSVPGKTPCLI